VTAPRAGDRRPREGRGYTPDCGHGPSGCPEDCHALDGYRPHPGPPRDVEALLRQANEAFRECDTEREREAADRETWRARALQAEAERDAAFADGARHGLLAAAWLAPDCDCDFTSAFRGPHERWCNVATRQEIAELAADGGGEWHCPHGIGHPETGAHGCDGCCRAGRRI
jgi:hypothetical protein